MAARKNPPPRGRRQPADGRTAGSSRSQRQTSPQPGTRQQGTQQTRQEPQGRQQQRANQKSKAKQKRQTSQQQQAGPKQKPRPHQQRPEQQRRRPHTRTDGNWITRAIRSVDAVTSTPRLDYIVMWCLTIFLTGFGLLMVLSSSTATSFQQTDSPWASFLKQAGMVLAGLVAMWIVLMVRPATIRKWSRAGMVIAAILLVLVLVPGIGVGLEEAGSQSWLALGPVTLQPSEVAKLAVAVWGSAELAKKAQRSANIREVFGKFTLVVLGVVLAVTLERDLGMVASVMIVFLALAWFVGLPKWVASVIGIGGLVLATGLILTAGFRSSRIVVWQEALLGKFTNVRRDAWQSYQGFLSLGDGSLTGQGLGQSRAKWFYLPEAKNDFIFAIVGEELGFIGAGIVILCFALLGWFGIKIAVNQVDPFLRLMAATITTGIVIQAFINIGYVVGLLPVTGIQLPLISSGGTSVIITLISMGLLLNCARHEPETISSMQSYGRPLIDKLLHLPEPEVYTPESTHLSQAHRRVQRFGEPVAGRRDAHSDGPWGEEDIAEDGAAPRGRSGSGGRQGRGGDGRRGGGRGFGPDGADGRAARSRADGGRGLDGRGRRTAHTSAVRKSARPDDSSDGRGVRAAQNARESRRGRGRDNRDNRDYRDNRDGWDNRDGRGRDSRDSRGNLDSRDPRGRDSRDNRDPRGRGRLDYEPGTGAGSPGSPNRRGRLSFERDDR